MLLMNDGWWALVSWDCIDLEDGLVKNCNICPNWHICHITSKLWLCFIDFGRHIIVTVVEAVVDTWENSFDYERSVNCKCSTVNVWLGRFIQLSAWRLPAQEAPSVSPIIMLLNAADNNNLDIAFNAVYTLGAEAGKEKGGMKKKKESGVVWRRGPQTSFYELGCRKHSGGEWRVIRRRALFRAHSGARFSDKLSTSWFLVPKLSTTATCSQGLYTLSCKWKVREQVDISQGCQSTRNTRSDLKNHIAAEIRGWLESASLSRPVSQFDLHYCYTCRLQCHGGWYVVLIFCLAGMICAGAKLTD